MPSSTDVPVPILNQPLVLKWVGLQSFFPYDVALILLQKRFSSHYFHNTCLDLLAWLLFKSDWNSLIAGSILLCDLGCDRRQLKFLEILNPIGRTANNSWSPYTVICIQHDYSPGLVQILKTTLISAAVDLHIWQLSWFAQVKVWLVQTW